MTYEQKKRKKERNKFAAQAQHHLQSKFQHLDSCLLVERGRPGSLAKLTRMLIEVVFKTGQRGQTNVVTMNEEIIELTTSCLTCDVDSLKETAEAYET